MPLETIGRLVAPEVRGSLVIFRYGRHLFIRESRASIMRIVQPTTIGAALELLSTTRYEDALALNQLVLSTEFHGEDLNAPSEEQEKEICSFLEIDYSNALEVTDGALDEEIGWEGIRKMLSREQEHDYDDMNYAEEAGAMSSKDSIKFKNAEPSKIAWQL